MRNLKALTLINSLIFGLSACAWQQNPTPSTLDNSVYNQNALNVILHSASEALGSTLLSQEIDNKNNYTSVYALSIKNKPSAISVISTPNNNTYFVNLIKSENISETLFAPNTKIVHSDTTITKVNYNNIHNQAAKLYLDSLGYNEKNYFLKRTTYFYQNKETLTLVDYIFPNLKTNEFDN